MNRYLLAALLALLLVSCGKKEADIYLFSFFQGNGEDGLHLAASTDGLTWIALNNNKSFLIPKVGNDKLMRDPCIIRGGDDKFHMVWTVSWNERGIGYANSSDLLHWSEQIYIPVMHHEAKAKNCWAPELFYDDETKEYIIFWATTIPGRFPETDSSTRNGNNHRIYSASTKDFKEFSPTKLFYDQGFNVIDATIIKANNSYTMFLKDETFLPEVEKNIRFAESKQLRGPYSEASAPISPNWVEGPTSIMIGKQWIVYYDSYTQHEMGAIASTDLKNWTNISDEVSFPEGTRHGTVLQIKESELLSLLTNEMDLHLAEDKIAFNQLLWRIKNGKDYPYRDKMLTNVLHNDSIRTLNRTELTELLGAPSYYRDNRDYLYYTINQKRLFSWPLHTKVLVVKFKDDDTIEWLKVHQ